MPAIGLVWLVLFWTCTAVAAPTPPSTERETARAFMVEGDRLRERGDLTNALQRYQSAHALMHVPTTGLAVAETQAQLGLIIEAQSVVREVLDMPSGRGEPVAFTKARDAALTLGAALEQRVCTLYTRVQPMAALYTVTLDGVTLRPETLTTALKLNPGRHTLTVRAPGYVEQTTELSLLDGVVQQVDFELEAVRLEAAVEPLSPLAVAQATHDTTRDQQRHRGRVRGLIGLGVGGLSLMVGVITGAVSWSQAADIKQHCEPDNGCDAALRSDLKVANTLGNIANVTVPLGVLGIAYGMYEILTLPEKAPAASRAALQLDIDVAPNGVLLRGRL